MATLQGIFDSYKTRSKKNFIQENVRQLRTLRKAWENNMNNREKQQSFPQKTDKFKHVTPRVPAHVTPSTLSSRKEKPSQSRTNNKGSDAPSRRSILSSLSAVRSGNIQNTESSQLPMKKSVLVQKPRIHPSANKVDVPVSESSKHERLNGFSPYHGDSIDLSNSLSALTISRPLSEASNVDMENRHHNVSGNVLQPIRNVGCQTVCPDDADSLHDGVIKYPSTLTLEAMRTSTSQRLHPLSTQDNAQQTEVSPVSVFEAFSGPVKTSLASNRTNRIHLNPTPADDAMSMSSSAHNYGQCSEHLQENCLHRYRGLPHEWKSNVGCLTNPKPESDQAPTKQKELNMMQNKGFFSVVQPLKISDVPNSSHSVGPAPLPESERMDMLRKLQKRYEDHIRQLNSLPVKTDTLKMKLRKIEIEKQLTELEEGIKIFSRSKVFLNGEA